MTNRTRYTLTVTARELQAMERIANTNDSEYFDSELYASDLALFRSALHEDRRVTIVDQPPEPPDAS
jgi:hypothetical protein